MRSHLMNRISTLAIVTLALVGVSAADPARATTVTFDFEGGCTSLCGTDYSTWADGNTRTFTGSDGETTVTAQAWSTTGGSSNSYIRDAFLGHYPQGLGVTNDEESGSNASHTTDNIDANDFIVFYFSAPVKVNGIHMTAYQASGVSDDPDTDISVWYGNVSGMLDFTGNTLADINLMFPGRIDDSGPNGQSVRTADISDDTDLGNFLIVGGSISDTSPEDLIKIGILSVDLPETPEEPRTEEAPEPMSGALLLGGLGSLWFARRRRAKKARA